MGHSQADKAASRERILAEAAGQLREAGPEALSVGRLMRSAGLTHGGFYGHFESRADLLLQALGRALEDSAAGSSFAPCTRGRPDFASSVRRYLSRSHRDAPASGCAIAAMASDLARAPEAERAVMGAHVQQFIDTLQAALAQNTGPAPTPTPEQSSQNTGASPTPEAQAMVTASTLVGALLLARLVDSPARSDALLAAARQHLLALAASGSAR